MPQTLLALLSMVVVSLYSFNQNQALLQLRTNMMRSEATARSMGVAIDRLEALRTLSYDEATRTDTIYTATDLTPYYGGGFDADTPDDDLDDFDGTTITMERTTVAGVLHFNVDTEIVYIDETDGETEVSFATKYKKATVKVYNTDLALPDTVYSVIHFD